MSTKIYNAFKFDKFYSLSELSKMIDNTRKAVQEKQKAMYFHKLLYQFNFYYNMYLLHTKEEIMEIYNKIEVRDKESKYVKNIYEYILKEDWTLALVYIRCLIREKIKYASKGNIMSYDYWLDSHMQIIPTGRKILVMLFGTKELQDIIENSLPLEDYHYQNQTDRPDYITARNWKQREKTWDKAIGPDYIPVNHGFSVDFNLNNLPLCLGTDNISENDKTELLSDILDTFEMPGKETTTNYEEAIKVWRSEEFKAWRTAKREELSKKVKALSPEDVRKLLKKKRNL